jgi:hypothetical protein
MDSAELLKRLIEFPTFQVSEGEVEEGMKQCAGFLSDYLEKIGFKVRVDNLCNVAQKKPLTERKPSCLTRILTRCLPQTSGKMPLHPDWKATDCMDSEHLTPKEA